MVKLNVHFSISALLVLTLLVSLSSALSVTSVDSPTLEPGEEGQLRMEIENPFDETVTDVSVNLDLKDIPFIAIGSSEQSIDEIDEDDEEVFVFTIKVGSDVLAGDYSIPYTISYELDNDEKTKSGTIGVKVSADPQLSFSVETQNAVEGAQGQLNLKIVNKGLFEARFVSVKILPQGFTLLTESEVYVGTIDSDDFETASFEVVFNKNAHATAIVEYRDFENNVLTETVDLPVTVYSKERALELGLTQRSNAGIYTALIILLILIIIIWRILKKRKRLKKSMKTQE